MHDQRFSGRPRSICSSPTRRRRASSSAGSRRCASEELVQMMVDADLERHRGATLTRRALVTGGTGSSAQWADARDARARLVASTAAGLSGAPEARLLTTRSASRRCAGRARRALSRTQVRAVVESARPTSSCISPAISHVPDAMRDPGPGLRGERRRCRATARRGRATARAAVRAIPSCSSSAARSSTGVTSASEMPLDETAEQRPADALRGLEGRAGDRGAPGASARRASASSARAASTTRASGTARQLSPPVARRASASRCAPTGGAD